ncbi:MAG: sulfite exporter TauE/SafE family protein [Alphaproteobacteria bacterium]
MEIWPDISIVEASAIAAVAFFAGVMRGFFGFGSALMIVPVASAFLGPQVAVPVVTAVHLVTSVQLLPRALADVEWARVAPLSIAGCFTIPIGAWVLATEDPEAIRKGISVLIIFFAFMMMRGWRYTGRINGWIMGAVGLIGGLITGAASVGGPPVVTFLMAGPFNAAQNRAAIILYFIFVQTIAMAMYWIGGLLVAQIIGACLLIMPTLMTGMWLGQNLFAKVSEAAFRRIALIFLMVIGIATLFL